MSEISRISKTALAIGSLALLLAAVIARNGSNSVLASAPNPKGTVITEPTAGPVLSVTNTGKKSPNAVYGQISQATGTKGMYPTAIVGEALGTTGEEVGVYGETTTPLGSGVAGEGLNNGTYGSASAAAGAGVSGLETGADGAAVYGTETYAAYKPPSSTSTFPPKTETAGVEGLAADGNGVVGITTYPYVNGSATSGVFGYDEATKPTANSGVTGITTNGNAGVFGVGVGTTATNPDIGESAGVIGQGPTGVGGIVTATAAPEMSTAEPTGAFIALVPTGTSTNKYVEYLALGTQGQTVFSVDQSGDLTYSGTMTASQELGNGLKSERTVAEVARPTLEDVGESALRNGVAYVTIDPNFSVSMEQRAPYMVFVTPGGEANQLYVTGKTPHGFYVRETRGTSSIPFDYRIVAYPKGDAQRRIAVRPDDPVRTAVYAERRERAFELVRPPLDVRAGATR